MTSSSLDRDKLLAALADLPDDRELALRTLPQVLNQHGEGHVSVTVVDPDGSLRIAASNAASLTPGMLVPTDGVVGLTSRQRTPTYLPDALTHPGYRIVGEQAYPVEFALPIVEREHAVAVLNIERDRPFSPAERRTLEAFTSAVGRYLTHVSRSRQASLATALSAQLADATTLPQAARAALDIIGPAVGTSAASLLSEHGGVMSAIAVQGATTAELYAIEYPRGLVWDACLADQARYTRDYQNDPRSLARLHPHISPVVLAIPIGLHETPRAALSLQYPPDAHVSVADIELLVSVCRHLAVILANIQATALQDHLFDLHTRALDSETNDIYQHVLDAAIEHVPGAEAGSLIVRPGDTEAFKYVAVNGFEFEEVRTILYSDHDMRLWYDGSDDEWNGGRARVLSAESLDLVEFSSLAGGTEKPITPKEMNVLKSTVCLPVAYRGEVLAVVNLDNFSREDAFGNDSLRTLTQFGPPVATLLAAAQHRDEMTRASRTDPLTGLVNRDGFRLQLEQELARSSRAGGAFTLLVMDLTGFKRINDTLGHAAGDEALVSVARALEATSRTGDVIGRWGGDEFVALLPDAGPEAAESAVERYERAIGEIEMGGHPLGVDIGAAAYPDDCVDAAELVRFADSRMYARKGSRRLPFELA